MRFPIAAPLLLATLLLSPVAAPAQKPANVPVHAAELPYRTIVLHHAHPDDVLTAMHWQDSRDVRSASLLVGVVRMFALRTRNILMLQATEAGYKQVQEIVKTLDVAPQQVQMTARFVAVPSSQKLAVDLFNPSQALLQMYNVNALFSEQVSKTTDNGKPIDFFQPWLFLNQPTRSGNHLESLPAVRLTPRINTDNSVTLIMNNEGPTAKVLEALRTVSSGVITVYDAAAFLPPSGYHVFLFVTPTILSAGANDGTIKVKP